MSLLPETITGSFQEMCSLEFDNCASLEKSQPGAGSTRWLHARQKLLAGGQPRIILADLDLRRANLKGFDLSRCYLTRVDFQDAELSGTNFRQSICRHTNFGRSYLHAADLSLVDLRLCNVNFATPVTDIRGIRPWLAEKIEIAQYRSDNSVDTKCWLLKQWFAITGDGSSLRTLCVTSVALILIFGAIFYGIQNRLNEKIFADHMSIAQAVEYSALVFMNSGPSLMSSNFWVVFAMTLEVAFGIAILALFIASLTRRLVIYR
jgi:hypothetical protein